VYRHHPARTTAIRRGRPRPVSSAWSRPSSAVPHARRPWLHLV